MAKSLTREWDPNKYRDTYKDEIMTMITRKVKSGYTATGLESEESSNTERTESGTVLDLSALLKKSLAEGAKRKQLASGRRKTA